MKQTQFGKILSQLLSLILNGYFESVCKDKIKFCFKILKFNFFKNRMNLSHFILSFKQDFGAQISYYNILLNRIFVFFHLPYFVSLK